jgi:hypothetical protein
MSEQIETKGRCSYCGSTYSKRGITRHLMTCDDYKKSQDKPLGSQRGKLKILPIYHLKIEGTYAPMYWMHLEMPGNMLLHHLDQFLRDEWVECCGHLSAFRIGSVSYSVYPSWPGDRSMKVELQDVLKDGLSFEYEYDFGSTTYINLQVMNVRKGPVKGHDIRVMVRNDPPVWSCMECGEPATEICTNCAYEEGGGWLCNKHAAEHECGEDMLLPVVNSPRVGECGYTG